MLHDAPGTFIEAQRAHAERILKAERRAELREATSELGPRSFTAATLRWLADRVDSTPAAAQTVAQEGR